MEVDMKRSHIMPTAAIIFGVSAAAVEFYSVRELVAALLMFAIVFGVVGAGFLVLIAAEELVLKGMTLLEPRFAYVRARTAASFHRHRDSLVRSSR